MYRVSMAVACCLLVHPAFAQANGDPGASLQGQLAAQKAEPKGTKSGANAMSKGASGGSGEPRIEGGSNSLHSSTGNGSGKQK